VTFRWHLLCLVLAAALPRAAPAADVVVHGRIVDASGRAGFAGASVTLDPRGLHAISAGDGTFRIESVPDGDYVLRVEYRDAPTLHRDVRVRGDDVELGDLAIGATVTELGEVIVIGRLGALADAARRKRASVTVVDSVSADAIGQLPDQNAAEVLQRLPGVSIVTEQGEGRFVSVRGIDPNLNAVSVGGVRLPTGEDDARQVELDLVPSELLQTLAVEKTLTPDRDADAIGASIELDTITAFDRAATSASATLQGSRDETLGDWSPKAFGSATRVFDTGASDLGIALAATWTKRRFGWATLENEDGWPVLEGPDGAFRSAPTIEQHNHRNDLGRWGFAFNLDDRRADESEWYLHTLHTEIDDAQIRELNRYRFDEGDVTALGPDHGTFDDASLEKTVQVRHELRDLTSLSAGYSRHAAPWTFDIDAALARTREREPDSMEAIFRGDTGLAYAGTGPVPSLTPTSAAGFDPSAFTLDRILNERDDSRDREAHLALDAQRDFSVGDAPAYVKIGAKARRREKSTDVDITTFDGFGGDVSLSQFATTNDYPFGDFGPVVAADPMRRFFEQGRGSFDVDEAQTLIDSLGSDYRIDEDIDAAYAMAGVDIDKLNLVGGARVERTRLHAEGTRLTVAEDPDALPTLAPVVDDKSYTDVLPGLHARYELSPTWLARAALTRSLARPSFGFLAPAQRIDILQGDTHVIRRAQIGNPELDPYRSSNVDIGLEYYGAAAIDSFSADAFYKRIDNPIVQVDLAGTGPYVDFDSAIVPVNGDSARLTGIELGYTHRYASLPPPWDGLLISANATLTDSDMRIAQTDRRLPLTNQSDRIANLIIGYTSAAFELRVAGNYRSPRLVRLDAPTDRNFDVYEGDHFTLDLDAQWQLDAHWRLQLDGVNLTNRPLYEFYGDPQHLARYETYGRTLRIGVRCDL